MVFKGNCAAKHVPTSFIVSIQIPPGFKYGFHEDSL